MLVRLMLLCGVPQVSGPSPHQQARGSKYSKGRDEFAVRQALTPNTAATATCSPKSWVSFQKLKRINTDERFARFKDSEMLLKTAFKLMSFSLDFRKLSQDKY